MSVVRAQEHRVHELSVRFPDLVEALRALSLFRAAEVRAAIHAPPYATGSSQSPPQDYHAQAPRRLQAAVGEACAALVRRREAGLLRHAARNGDGFIMSLLRPVAVPVAGQDPKPLVHGVDSLGGLVQTSCVVSDAGELLCIDHRLARSWSFRLSPAEQVRVCLSIPESGSRQPFPSRPPSPQTFWLCSVRVSYLWCWRLLRWWPRGGATGFVS